MDDGNSLKLKEIGNRIRAARVEQHMSQDALAFEADLSLSTMSDIELGNEELRYYLYIWFTLTTKKNLNKKQFGLFVFFFLNFQF